MCTRATPAIKVAVVQTNKSPTTARMKGNRRIPPPGAMISETNDIIVLAKREKGKRTLRTLGLVLFECGVVGEQVAKIPNDMRSKVRQYTYNTV